MMVSYTYHSNIVPFTERTSLQQEPQHSFLSIPSYQLHGSVLFLCVLLLNLCCYLDVWLKSCRGEMPFCICLSPSDWLILRAHWFRTQEYSAIYKLPSQTQQSRHGYTSSLRALWETSQLSVSCEESSRWSCLLSERQAMGFRLRPESKVQYPCKYRLSMELSWFSNLWFSGFGGSQLAHKRPNRPHQWYSPDEMARSVFQCAALPWLLLGASTASPRDNGEPYGAGTHTLLGTHVWNSASPGAVSSPRFARVLPHVRRRVTGMRHRYESWKVALKITFLNERHCDWPEGNSQFGYY